VLFLWGTKDTTIVTPQTRKAAKFVPNWQDIAVENKGHWLLVEAKDFVNNAVTKWLHQVLAARSAECPTQKSKL
jgi:pimeloyl-ACP methyl ester carboxylesterase